MSNTVFAVSTTAELYDALNNASGGDVIELADGQYDALSLRQYKNLNVTFDTAVTLRSADPDAPTKITGMAVNGASNLIFENLVFDYSFEAGDTWRTSPFEVIGSTGVTFRDCRFDGDVGFGDTPETDGFPSAHGLILRSSTHVTVEDCEISGFARGIKAGDTQDLAILRSEFHGQRSDNIAIGADTQRITIADNYMHDFFVAPDSPDHRDMIQFWNDGGSVATTDVVISGNVMVLGEEDHLTQSIFIGNGAVGRQGAGEEMYFQNFTITENVIVNAQKHGIYIGASDGVLIANNTLLREDVRDGNPKTNVPEIAVESFSHNVEIRDNVTTRINGHDAQPDWIVDGNVLIQDLTPLGANYYDELFVNAAPGLRSDLANIQVLPGSVIAETGAGASSLAYDDTPETLTPLVHAQRHPAHWTDYVFDASYTAGPDGPTGAEAQYHWDFGDGTQATGLFVTHSYYETGRYEVTLTVTGPEDETAVTTTVARVGTPDILRLDPGTGTLVLADGADEAALAAETGDPDGAGGTEARAAVLFNGTETGHKIETPVFDGLHAARDFAIELSLGAANWTEDYGEVLRVKGAFSLRVDAEGRPSFSMTTDAGETRKVTGETLADGVWTDLAIRFDGGAGTLTMLADGEEVATTEAGPQLAASFKPALSLGTITAKKGFTGAMSALEITANENAYVKLGAAPDVVPIDLDFDGFDLKEEHDTPDGPVELMGDAEYHAGTDSFVLDGDGDALSIAHESTASLGDQILVELDYCRDAADGANVRLAWFHARLTIEAVGDGLSLMLRNGEGSKQRFQIKDLGLNDTDWHSLRLMVDNEDDRATLFVDDEIVFVETETDIAVDDPGLRKVWDWQLGGAWSGYLDGQISHFRVGDELPPDTAEPLPLDDDVFAF